MAQRIVLIRAVNVGGTAKLPMGELREIADELGATEVSTYIASGNLLCTPAGEPDVFDRRLEQAIEERFGYFRDVISRSAREVAEALSVHPFEVLEPKFSYVSFLKSAPSDEAIAEAEGVATHDDRWAVIGRNLHIRYASGAGQAQMNVAALGRAIGVPATARNLVTVRKLIDLAG